MKTCFVRSCTSVRVLFLIHDGRFSIVSSKSHFPPFCSISRCTESTGYPTFTKQENRSRWASGRGNVPWYSIGFCVAMMRWCLGSSYSTPDREIFRSSMHCKKALWVFGCIRLISSMSTSSLNIGPFLIKNDFCSKS